MAAFERFFIHDDTLAFVFIGASYLAFVVYDNLIPKSFFFYLLTRVRYFDPPDCLEKTP